MNLNCIDSYLDIKAKLTDNIVFCDFEFNDFTEKRPISIGLSHMNQEVSFYGEILWPEGYDKLNDWLKSNVIPHLEGNSKPFSEIKLLVDNFISSLPEGNIYFLTDSDMDLSILSQEFKHLNITICTYDLYFKALYWSMEELSKEDKHNYFFHILHATGKFEEYFSENSIIQHHALNDATVLNRLIFKALNENKEQYNAKYKQ